MILAKDDRSIYFKWEDKYYLLTNIDENIKLSYADMNNNFYRSLTFFSGASIKFIDMTILSPNHCVITSLIIVPITRSSLVLKGETVAHFLLSCKEIPENEMVEILI